MNELLIHNVDVLRCADSRCELLESHDIFIRDNRIARIAPSGTLSGGDIAQSGGSGSEGTGTQLPSEGSEDITSLDGRGMLAMPGLINTHAHVPMCLFRGLAEDVDLATWFNDYIWPLESNLTEDDVYWGMQLGLVEMVEAGVTSVADHYFHMKRVAQAVEQAGTRAALGWAVFGSQGDEGIDITASFAREHNNTAGDRITTWLAPHAPYTCEDAFLEKIAEQAEALDLGIHIHAAETQEQTAASVDKYGRTPIEVLDRTGVLSRPTLLAHCCGATPDDIALMAERGCGVAHAPKTYLKLAMGAAPVQAFSQAGVPVGLATDGPVSNNTLDVLESLRLMAMVAKHEGRDSRKLPVAEALHIATRQSARVFGRPDDLGHLAPGYLADIILVDLSGAHHQPLHDPAASLVYSARASDVQTVICDGRIIMQDRQLLTLDKDEIYAKVAESMTRLSQRVPGSRIQRYQP